MSMVSLQMLRALLLATILAGALAGSAMAQAPDAGCALPSEPEGIPAELDAAITGPADKDRACMKAPLIPEVRMIFVSLGTGGAPTYFARYVSIMQRGKHYCENNECVECWLSSDTYMGFLHLWRLISYGSSYRRLL